MEQVNMRMIFFFAVAAIGASMFSSMFLRLTAVYGPGSPFITGIILGIALAAVMAFYRWFYARQFERHPTNAVYPVVAGGIGLVAVFAFVANWEERLAWLIATAVLVAWWLLHNMVLARPRK